MAKKTTVKRRKSKWASLNLLRPGTYSAYTILEHVGNQVLDEPKRLYMSTWIGAFRGMGARRHARICEIFETGQAPECGTIACAAGWVGLNLRMPRKMIEGDGVIAFLSYSFSLREDLILLFTTQLRDAPGDYGTQAYARFFVRRLHEVMGRHSDELKARRITITPAGAQIAR